MIENFTCTIDNYVGGIENYVDMMENYKSEACCRHLMSIGDVFINCWIYIVKREFTLDFFLLKWSNKSENRIKRLVSKTQKYDFYLNDHSSFCIGTFCFCWLHFSIVSDFVNLFQNESFISIVLIFCSLCKRIQCTPSMFICNTFDDMKRDC